jgi:hypothetical protein
MSAGLPPPPNFLAMALQAEQQRRQKEQDALQKVLLQQQQQDRAEQLGLQALQMGGKLKDVEVSYGAEAGPQTVARWRIYADAQKRKEQEAANAQAAQPLVALLQKLATGGAQNTEAYGNTVSSLAQLLPPEQASPIFESVSTQAQAAPTLAAMQQIAAQQKAEQTLAEQGALERQKARIAREKELSVASGKEQIKTAYEVLKGQDIDFAQSIVDGSATEADIAKQLAGDPMAAIRMQRVRSNALQKRAAEEPYEDAVAILQNNGVPVEQIPRGVLRRLAPGQDSNGNLVLPTAFLSPTTGLPLLGKEGGKQQQTVEILETALHQLDTLEAAARVIAENRGNAGLVRAAKEQIAASLNAGLTEGDVATYYALRNVATPGVARASGEVGNLTETEQKRAQSVLPSVITAITNPKTSKAQLEAARQFLRNRLRAHFDVVYGNNTELYKRRFRDASRAAIEEASQSYRREWGAAPALIVEEVP